MESMRELIEAYSAALSKEEQEAELMNGTQRANDAFGNQSVDYYDKDQYSPEEKVHRLSFKPKGMADNPVDTYTLGNDGDNKATPDFSFGPKLDALHNLKVSVEVLERLHHISTNGIFALNSNLTKESAAEVKKLLDEMRAKIDFLSDDLMGDRV
jgi:hypothetical protein